MPDEATTPHDLTQTLGSYLDRHLLIPLLDHLKSKNLYPAREIEQAKLELMFGTNMVDAAVDIYGELNSTKEVPDEYTKRREEVLRTMTQLHEEVQPILDLVQDPERVNELRQEKNFTPAYLQQLSITPSHIEVLHRYAKFIFDCGDYVTASNLLMHYRMLSTTSEKALSALWGKLACEILLMHWDQALEDLTALKEAIDSSPSLSPLMQLQQRSWLMHWSLFLLGNHPNGRNIVADLFFQERYLNTIQNNCPHLLRYLCVAVITNPRRRASLKDLVRIISMEKANFSDPITSFIEELCVTSNFDEAQGRLKECAAAIDQDFFLSNAETDFMTHARLYIFESYCRIHERIDLKMLAQKLNMEQIAAEKWIVKMVSDAQLNAKIDAQSGHVILGLEPPDVYLQVIEKTKGLSFRSYVLAQNIEKRSIQPTTSRTHGS
ncbi:hypothetical protein AB1Y20_020195 [Prymnesium parvum]|uniref:Eukaryotic translation initiation factor 3 subunit E n=1 Tax=Prymnesium parvum TaxID=97485 RepID=A0AB34JUI7_PRYPA